MAGSRSCGFGEGVALKSESTYDAIGLVREKKHDWSFWLKHLFDKWI